MIDRYIQEEIRNLLFTGKTIVLLGARQVGKSTLLKQLSKSVSAEPLWMNGDIVRDRDILKDITPERAQQLFPEGSLVFIDEAQRIENTGLTLKIIHDHCAGIQLIATGSSAFELTDKLREPLTGRKWTLRLYPISHLELIKHQGMLTTLRQLESRVMFGSYPDVLNYPGKERSVLEELANDYLYKDVFSLTNVRKPEGLQTLVKALAFQVGNEVSFRELAEITGLDKETVERYIILLEEAFVIFRLPAFSRNLRNELKRGRKIYFWDNGIRNAVIDQFSPLSLRQDKGALWENFLISERQKMLRYTNRRPQAYFWRTIDQQEIDYVEVSSDSIEAFEMKWNPRKKAKKPVAFGRGYPDASFNIIHPDNYLDFVLGE